MKKIYLQLLLTLAFIVLSNLNAASQRYWVSAAPAVWSSDSWSATSGGATDGGGPPTAGVAAVFNANGLGNCILDVNATFDGINTTGYTSIIDINGFVFNPSTGGAAVVTLPAGTINDGLGTSSLTYTTTATSTFSGATFNTPININVGSINFAGGVFNNPVTVVKNGSTSVNGAGGCTFNSTLSITNNGTSYYLMGFSNPDIFNGDLTLINIGTSNIRMAYNSGGNQINGNLIIGSTNGTGVWFGEGGSSSTTIATGNTISIAGSGFTAGDLRLSRFTQAGADATTINTTGTSAIYLGPSSTFNGNFTAISPNIYVRGGTYNNPVSFTKTGGIANHNNGAQNIFNSTLEINQQSTTYFMLGYNSNDLFNDDITVSSVNTGLINIGFSGGTGTPTLAAGKTIKVGGAGFNQGGLYLGSFTQLGNTPISLPLTGASFWINNAPNSSLFGGALDVIADNIYVGGGTFNAPVKFTKTGSADNHNSGKDNTFNSTLEINQQGTGYFMLGYNSNDLFNDDITITSVNTGLINLGFSSGTGTPTLAAGKTITVGGAGFSQGGLYLGSFTQLGNATMTLPLTGASFTVNNVPNSCVFGGDLDVTADNVTIRGGTFNGATKFTKLAGVDNHNNGGKNIFNSTLEINNKSTGYIMLGYLSNDEFHDDISVSCTNTGFIRLGHSVGVQSPTLDAGKTILVGTDGMTNGGLYLGSFTQLGSASMNLPFSNLSTLNFFQSTIGGDLVSSSELVTFNNSTFNGTVIATATGSGTSGGGGNTFNDDVIIDNAGSSPWYTGLTTKDDFLGNLTVTNNGTYLTNIAHNSLNNTVAGNLTVTNAGSGPAGNRTLSICNGSNVSSLAVTGNLTATNTGSANNLYTYIAENGILNIGGDVTITNSGTGNISDIRMSNGTNSKTTITGNTAVTNNNTAVTTSRIWLGVSGDNDFNGTLDIVNKAGNTNSEIFLNYGTASSNNYYDDITVSTLSTTCDGIYFGIGTGVPGSGTLAIGKTISIPGVDVANFLGGRLSFRGFTQLGAATPHSFELSSTASFIYSDVSNWGSNVNFTAPRIYNLSSTFSGTSYFEKTGAIDDNFGGLNTYTGNAIFVNNNTVANGSVQLASTNPSQFGANVTLRNIGSFGSLDLGSAVGAYSIPGNLTMENNGTGSGVQNMYVCEGVTSAFTIGGDVNMSNSSITAGSHSIGLGMNGTVIINGNTSVSNINSNGTSKNVYLGQSGDITFNGTLSMISNSNATNNHFYLNNLATSNNLYNDDITVQSLNTACDGYFFGFTNGSGTLAATKSITIDGVDVTNFIGGSLYFRNFTQTGPTNHSFELASTANDIYNYDSNWGGDVIFIAPRLYNRTSTYSGTSYFEKTGSVNNDFYGGCTHTGDAEYVQNNTVAAGRLYIASTLPNTFGGNLTIRNTGSFDHILYGSAAGTHTVAGDLVIENASTGTGSQYAYFLHNAAAIADIAGSASFTNNASTTGGAHRIYVSNIGQVNITGNATAINSSTGTDSYIYLGNVGSIAFGGNLNLTNSSLATVSAQIRVAEGVGSSVTIAGNTTLNSSTIATSGYCYFGYSGDVTFEGTLDMTNNSSGTNNHIYLNDRIDSENFYNNDVFVKSTHVNSDGFWFGNGGGAGTLAATKSMTIPGVDITNFIGGRLYFRNFTQIGPTDHSFELASTADYIYNYDCNWGGNVDFRSPRIYNRTSTFSGTSVFEKRGSANNDFYGGCTHVGDALYIQNNTVAPGRMYIAGSQPNSYGGNLTLRNSGSFDHLLYGSCVGITDITGDVIVENLSTGTGSQYVYLSSNAGSVVNVGGGATILNNANTTSGAHRIYFSNSGQVNITGNATAINSSTGTDSYIYIGNLGGVAFGGNLDLTNSSLATTSAQIRVAEGVASTVSIAGNTTLNSSTVAASGYCYFGYSGDVTFNGTLDMTNNSSGTNNHVYLNDRATSVNFYNDDVDVKSTHVDSDGFWFGNGGGFGTLAATKLISIPGVDVTNFIGGRLHFRNFTQVGNTPHSFELASTADYIYNYDSDWGGNVNFIAPRIYNRGTIFNGLGYFEKTGAGGDASYGGCTHIGNAEYVLDNNVATGYFYIGHTVNNTYDGDLTMSNIGDFDEMRYTGGTGLTTIGGDLSMTNSTTGTGNQYVYFLVNNAATANIAGNATVMNNATGISGSHNSYFGNNGAITVDGNTDITNTLGGVTKLVYVGNAGSIAFGGDLDLTNSSSATNAQIRMAESTLSTNTVAGNTTVTNTASGTTGVIYLGYSGDITFNGTLDMINSSSSTSSLIYLNDRATSANFYNDDVTLTSTHLNNDGFHFGAGTGAGTLAANKTISIPGVDATNFIGGEIYFRNFTQIGATAQSLDLPSTTYRINNYQSYWGGDVDFRAPRMYTYGSTYDGTAYFEKNGAVNDNSTGGNVFNGNTTFKVTSTGYFMPCHSVVNDFNANATYIKTGTGPMYPAYNCANTYAGDVTIESNTTMYFGAAGGGRVIMDGTIAQNINSVGATPATNVRDLQVNKAAEDVTINAPINITVDLDLDQGIVNTSVIGGVSTLTVNDNAYVSSVSDASHVDGPVDKLGNDVFNFPVGNNGYYRYIGMSNPSAGNARFRGQYFDVDPDNDGYDDDLREASLNHISDCEYWTLDRITSSNNVLVTLSFDTYKTGCSGITDPSLLDVARWDVVDSEWKNHGNGANSGATSGTVQTNGAVTSFSPFTFASRDITVNPLPVDLISFNATKTDKTTLLDWQTASEINNDFFDIEKSSDGVSFKTIGSINGNGNSNSIIDYSFEDQSPLNGVNYYRLKQVDFNGDFEYSAIRTVSFELEGVLIYPNPASDIINIKTPFTNGQYNIYDVSGKIISRGQITSEIQTIDASRFNKGIYFVETINTNTGERDRLKIKVN